MIRIFRITFISLLAAATVFPAFAENAIIFRYNPQSARSETKKPDDGGGNTSSPSFLELVPVFSGSGIQSSSQEYIKVYGNDRYSGQGQMRFVVAGFKSTPQVSSNVPDSYSYIMPLPAGSIPGVENDAYYYVQMVEFGYGDKLSVGKITFKADGKELILTFNIGRRDFDHAPLSINAANWGNVFDLTTTSDVILNSGSFVVRGGVPPYSTRITINGNSFPNDTGGLLNPFTSETLTEKMNHEADKGANFTVLNSPMTEVNATIRPMIIANQCSGEDLTVAETKISFTITDSLGDSVTSPTQSILYTPNGPHCVHSWGFPRSDE